MKFEIGTGWKRTSYVLMVFLLALLTFLTLAQDNPCAWYPLFFFWWMVWLGQRVGDFPNADMTDYFEVVYVISLLVSLGWYLLYPSGEWWWIPPSFLSLYKVSGGKFRISK